MFWGFLLFLVLALVFAQLGAYSAWFAILKGGLYLAFAVIGGLAIVLLWQRVFGQKNKLPNKGRPYV